METKVLPLKEWVKHNLPQQIEGVRITVCNAKNVAILERNVRDYTKSGIPVEYSIATTIPLAAFQSHQGFPKPHLQDKYSVTFSLVGSKYHTAMAFFDLISKYKNFDFYVNYYPYFQYFDNATIEALELNVNAAGYINRHEITIPNAFHNDARHVVTMVTNQFDKYTFDKEFSEIIK